MAENAVRDSNDIPSLLGAYNGATIRLKADHATGYLKVKVIPATISAPTVVPTEAVKDNSNVSSLLGAYNGAVKPLFASHSGKYLRVVFR